jgi:molecular chaperone DnaK
VSGNGFLVTGRLLATGRRLLTEEAGGSRKPVEARQVRVQVAGVWREVEAIVPHPSGLVDVSLLRLSPAVEAMPLRVGYPRLVRVGETVWTVAPAGEMQPETVLSGVVNKFETFPDLNLRLFQVGLAAAAGMSGSPLFNALGEVVGVLTVKERGAGSQESTSCFAITADALRDLLPAPWADER